MKKVISSFIVFSLILTMFGSLAFAATAAISITPARGAEFEDHSLIDLVTANGQIGAVRVSDDPSTLTVETYLWPSSNQLVEYTLAVANDVSGLPNSPSGLIPNGATTINKTFPTGVSSTIDHFSYLNLNPNIIVLAVQAVIRDENGQLTNAWSSGLPPQGKQWNAYFEYVKRTPTADTIPPQASISVDPPSLTLPNRRMVPIHVSINASDNSGKPVAIRLKSITSNEPDQGLGFFDLPNDIQDAQYGTYDLNFSLRAENSIRGNGREYTITYAIVDEAGNTSDIVTSVKVPPVDLVKLKEKLREEALQVCQLLKRIGFFGTGDISQKIEQFINNYMQKTITASYGETN